MQNAEDFGPLLETVACTQSNELEVATWHEVASVTKMRALQDDQLREDMGKEHAAWVMPVYETFFKVGIARLMFGCEPEALGECTQRNQSAHLHVAKGCV
jgi:hypothetical protein